LPAQVTLPATEVPPCFRVKLAPVIDAGSIASLKIAVTSLLMATSVSPSAGSLTLTTGAMVSGSPPPLIPSLPHPASRAAETNAIASMPGECLDLNMGVSQGR
jgi:hypothetical protein